MTKNIHPDAGTHPQPTLEKGLELGAIANYVEASTCSPIVSDELEHNPATSRTVPLVRVEILAPQHGSTLDVDEFVRLSASASKGSVDLSPQVSWHSSIDGALGSGRAVRAKLSDGVHTLSASIIEIIGTEAPPGTETTATIGVLSTQIEVCPVCPPGGDT